MKKDKWKQYSKYLSDFHYKTDRVLRDKYSEFHQFPEDRPDFRNSIDSSILLQRLLEVIHDTLTDREAMVIMLRFGIIDGTMWTLEQCGMFFDVGRERIRQNECKALRKLRTPSRLKRLMCPQEIVKYELEQIRLHEEYERERQERWERYARDEEIRQAKINRHYRTHWRQNESDN